MTDTFVPTHYTIEPLVGSPSEINSSRNKELWIPWKIYEWGTIRLETLDKLQAVANLVHHDPEDPVTVNLVNVVALGKLDNNKNVLTYWDALVGFRVIK